MSMNQKEIATLEVRGKAYTDWKAVQVHQRRYEPYPTFSFEATEDSPLPNTWNKFQVIPGDIVRVLLGGVLAVYGYVEERHVGYDGRNHGIRVVGVGKTYDIPTSSVPLDKLGNHDGKSWMQLAQTLSEHLGIKIVPVGNVDNEPFEQIQVQPGETIWQTLDRYARMRKIQIGSDENGNLLAIGDHSGTSSGDLVEGENILRANGAIRETNMYRKIFVVGQQNMNDEHNGDSSSKQIGKAEGSHPRNRQSVIVAEIADKQHGIDQRAQMEKLFTEGARLEINITVQGWFKPDGKGLWKAGEYYTVKSPMLMPEMGTKPMLLGCLSSLYEQSDAGTTTTLTLVDPAYMKGRPYFGPPTPGTE